MYIITFVMLVVLAMLSSNVYTANTKEYKLYKDLLNSLLFLVLATLFLIVFSSILIVNNVWLFGHIAMLSVILSNLSVYFINRSS